ncbi:MAG: DUF2865 domain-containing protein [Hyphomicrobium sp.]|nr:DUF2865 domain-containing protein [Hyphomicrobium sp.]
MSSVRIERLIWSACLAAAIGFVALAATADAVRAQGFFQQLFGFGKTSAQTPAPKSSGLQSRSFQSFRSYYSSRRDAGDFDMLRPIANYRLMCVRTCDGYYWPVGTAENQDEISKGESACRAACAGDAEVYSIPRGSSDIAAMTTRDGSRYDQLKNAFLYRQRLVAGCGCRPAPWSIAERYRHSKYAAEEAGRRAKEAFLLAQAEADRRRQDAISRMIVTSEQAPEDVQRASVDDVKPVTTEAALAHMLPNNRHDIGMAVSAAGVATSLPNVQVIDTAPEAIGTVTVAEFGSSAFGMPYGREPGTRVLKSSSAEKRRKRQKSQEAVAFGPFGWEGSPFSSPGEKPKRH